MMQCETGNDGNPLFSSGTSLLFSNNLSSHGKNLQVQDSQLALTYCHQPTETALAESWQSSFKEKKNVHVWYTLSPASLEPPIKAAASSKH